MDIAAVVSATAAAIGVAYMAISNQRSKRQQAMLEEAHRMVWERHLRGESEQVKQAFAARLVDAAYQAAAKDPGAAGLQGFAFRLQSPFERDAALSLKGDPRVADVTMEKDGLVRLWVDGSGFPNSRH